MQVACHECRVLFDEDLLVQSDVFGVRWVCEDCDEALSDEGTYEAHQDDEPGCDCVVCRRHLGRVAKRENERQLGLALGAGPVAADEDIDF